VVGYLNIALLQIYSEVCRGRILKIGQYLKMLEAKCDGAFFPDTA